MFKIWRVLINSHYRDTAFKVALVVGSILFIINHGQAVIQNKMNRSRWIAALLTYIVPYSVSIHGQHCSNSQKR